MKNTWKEIFKKAAISLVAVLIAVILGEAGLRHLFSGAYYIWPSGFHTVFKPLPEIMPGIYGESKFIANSKGIRGAEIPAGKAYKILAIGGSATECTFLDQTEAWPFLLEKKLAGSTGLSVWVGNIGKSGNTTRHNILQMRCLLRQFPDTDAVLALVGINDLTIALSRGPGYAAQDESEEEMSISSFSMIPLSHRSHLPFYKKTAIWQVCKKLRYLIFSGSNRQDTEGRQYITWRGHRKKAKTIIDVLPDMSMPLEEYSRNINTMIDLAKERNTRLIFITQPTLWRRGLSRELENLMWLGGIGDFQKEEGKEYYSPSALAGAMKMYNDTLLDICLRRKVECVDLAGLLPKDTSVFYDDCHFNEEGSEKAAELISLHMLQHKPFKEDE